MSFEIEAEEAIKESGGRISNQRKTLIRLLANRSEQIDAESLYHLAQQEDPKISLATVYRTLTTLAEAGLVQVHYLSPEHERQYFERNQDREMLHVVCRQCHRSYPIAGDILAELKDAIVNQQDWHHLTICSCVTGLCPECYAKGIADENSKNNT